MAGRRVATSGPSPGFTREGRCTVSVQVGQGARAAAYPCRRRPRRKPRRRLFKVWHQIIVDARVHTAPALHLSCRRRRHDPPPWPRPPHSLRSAIGWATPPTPPRCHRGWPTCSYARPIRCSSRTPAQVASQAGSTRPSGTHRDRDPLRDPGTRRRSPVSRRRIGRALSSRPSDGPLEERSQADGHQSATGALGFFTKSLPRSVANTYLVTAGAPMR